MDDRLKDAHGSAIVGDEIESADGEDHRTAFEDYRTSMFTALGPFPLLSGSVSNDTFCPSRSDWMPEA